MLAPEPQSATSPAAVQIRSARYEDIEAMRDIYNETVAESAYNFDTAPKSRPDMRWWFEAHNERRPVLVAVHGDAVVGWVSLSDWSAQNAYADTAEISMFVTRTARGAGIGRRLLQAVLQEAADAGIHVIVARMAADNAASIALHRNAGFEVIGTMREVARKDRRLLDVLLMQYIVPNSSR